MKTISIVLATALLFASAGTKGALKAIEQAYELSLSQVSLPSSVPAGLLIRPCAGCKPETLRITGDTRFFIGPATAPVSLADVRKAASNATDRRHSLVFVYYDPKSRNVRRLILSTAI
jgi:hypothetical protein